MDLDEWYSRGRLMAVGEDEVFVLDTAPTGPQTGPALFVVHGFPTSSIDWAPVLPRLAEHRRVVLFDLPGFGLSAKPDRPYSISSAADAAEGVLSRLGLSTFDLLTHDMGDTVGGELLARDLRGELTIDNQPPRIRSRVVTNGSIYLEMAQLTDGQHALWSAPDEMLPAEVAPTVEMMVMALSATLAPEADAASRPEPADLRVAAEAVCHAEGARLLPRLIRYLSDRRDNEARFTGAIETHPAPLRIVWGALDPIAVVAMAQQLATRRADATLRVLEGVGHYPMLEAPDRFAEAVISSLDAIG